MGCSHSQNSANDSKPTLVPTSEQDVPIEPKNDSNEPNIERDDRILGVDLEISAEKTLTTPAAEDDSTQSAPQLYAPAVVQSEDIHETSDKERDESGGEEHNELEEEDDFDESAVDFITPHVGFVIKTKRVMDNSKVFINLFYHDHKDLLGFVLSAPAKWSRDKKGADCEAYDVTVPKQFFLQSAGSDAARKEVIHFNGRIFLFVELRAHCVIF